MALSLAVGFTLDDIQEHWHRTELCLVFPIRGFWKPWVRMLIEGREYVPALTFSPEFRLKSVGDELARQTETETSARQHFCSGKPNCPVSRNGPNRSSLPAAQRSTPRANQFQPGMVI